METQASADHAGSTAVDLLDLVRRRGWTPARITALRNTCAAAARTESMPAADRALASAVAAALTAATPGISPAQLDFLVRAALLDPVSADGPVATCEPADEPR